MADPLELAAEEMAPSRPATSFFAENANPAFRAAAAGRRLEDQQLVSQAVSGLADSRLQRRLRRREEMLFDREEKEIMAKDRWKASRGDFLSQISRLDETAPDYNQARNDLISSLPPEALQDDAFQSIMRFKDGMAADLMARKEEAEREQRYIKRGRESLKTQAVASLLELGVPQDAIADLEDENGEFDFNKVFRTYGEWQRKLKSEEARAKAQAEANEPISPSEARTRIAAAIEDEQAFPSDVNKLLTKYKNASKKDAGGVEARTLENLEAKWPEEYARAKAADDRKAADFIAIATRMDQDDFVNYREGLSDQAKERRAKVWEWAQLAMGEDPGTGEEIPEPGRQLPQVEEELPFRGREAAPKQKVPLDEMDVELDTFKG